MSTEWPEGELVRRLSSVLRIAAKTVRHLAAHGYTDTADRDEKLSGMKVVAETALLLLAAFPAGQRFSRISEEIADLAAELIPCARSNAVRVGLCMRPALTRDYGMAHVCLTAIGYPDAEFDRLYRESIQAGSAGAIERLPYRMMEQRWLDRVWLGNGLARVDARLARDSMLGLSPNALCATRDDVYAFTHALMYATDLGTRPHAIPRSRRMIFADAEAALARSLDTEDYDLAGEVLLTWPILSAKWSLLASFAFRVLARVEDEYGFLPSLGTDVERWQRLGNSEDQLRYFLATAYHTVYVMGVLCALMLRPGGTVPGPIRSSSVGLPASDFDDVMDLLYATPRDGQTRPPHWVRELDAMEPQGRTALALLLLTVCLQRAASRHDLRRLQETLRLAVRTQLLAGPAIAEAARVLKASLWLQKASESVL